MNVFATFSRPSLSRSNYQPSGIIRTCVSNKTANIKLNSSGFKNLNIKIISRKSNDNDTFKCVSFRCSQRISFCSAQLNSHIVATADSETDDISPYNFSKASERDSIVHGCESPGNPQEGDISSAETVARWMNFMSGRGIKRVVCIMNDAELKRFEVDLLDEYAKQMTSVVKVDMGSPGAADKLAEAYEAAAQADEKVVTHCVGGMHRTGMALSSWVAKKYNLSPDEAVKEMLQTSLDSGCNRAATEKKLEKFLSS